MAKTVEVPSAEPVVIATMKGKCFTSKQAILDFLRLSVKRYRGLGLATKQEYKQRNCPVIAEAYQKMHKVISATREETMIADAQKKGPRDLGREIAGEQRRKFIPSQDLEHLGRIPAETRRTPARPAVEDDVEVPDEDLELDVADDFDSDPNEGLDFGDDPAAE